MKRFAAILSAALLLLGLAACTVSAPPSDDSHGAQNTDTPSPTPTPTPSPSPTPAPEISPTPASPTPPPETSPVPSPTAPSPSPTPPPTPSPTLPPSPEAPGLSGTSLEDIMAAIVKDVEKLPVQWNEEITPESFSRYLFIDYIDGAEGLAGEPMIGSIPHSVCLLRLPEGADAQKIAGEIEKNADPRKWICVGADKVVVSTNGNLVLLVMSTKEIADAVDANFRALG